MQRQRGLDFVHNKIKGTIAEIIFQHMFSDGGFATVLPFGYEHTQPVLAQYQHLLATVHALDHIRDAPDFILVKPDHTDVRLVEAKYRRTNDPSQVAEIITRLLRHWPTSWLFLATQDGFYFGPCQAIAEEGGRIHPLHEGWVRRDIQARYHELLREFIR